MCVFIIFFYLIESNEIIQNIFNNGQWKEHNIEREWQLHVVGDLKHESSAGQRHRQCSVMIAACIGKRRIDIVVTCGIRQHSFRHQLYRTAND